MDDADIFVPAQLFDSVFILLVTWCCCCSRCCCCRWSCLTSVERETKWGKNKYIKFPNPPTDWVITTDQWKLKGLGAKTNSPRKFSLISLFRLILFEITSHQFILWFRLKYIRVFYMGCAFALHCTTQENRMQVFWETFSEIVKKH